MFDCCINSETSNWNHEMIDGILIPQEAEIIKKIPLSRKEAVDTTYWPLAKNGE